MYSDTKIYSHLGGTRTMNLSRLLEDACNRSIRYLSAVDRRPISPHPAAIERVRADLAELPSAPSDPIDVVRILDEVVGPATVVNSGGRYFGFVNGGTLPAALASSWLVSTWDQNAALRV